MQVFAPSLPPIVPINQHEIQIWLNIRIKIYEAFMWFLKPLKLHIIF